MPPKAGSGLQCARLLFAAVTFFIVSPLPLALLLRGRFAPEDPALIRQWFAHGSFFVHYRALSGCFSAEMPLSALKTFLSIRINVRVTDSAAIRPLMRQSWPPWSFPPAASGPDSAGVHLTELLRPLPRVRVLGKRGNGGRAINLLPLIKKKNHNIGRSLEWVSNYTGCEDSRYFTDGGEKRTAARWYPRTESLVCTACTDPLCKQIRGEISLFIGGSLVLYN